LNLQNNPSETYFSCPYCLTEIEIVKAPTRLIVEQDETEEAGRETVQPEIEPEETKINQESSTNKVACNFHPGYLSERSSNEQIPDECLVCKDIVDCMLKKMRE
jgi:hypothetical protein